MQKDKITVGLWAIAHWILLLIKEKEDKEELKKQINQIIEDMYEEFS